ncbi:hypothetical protein HK096_009947 [Nowakowskiella sp. JEL0078]|nr:hypothetical protein HK096_009947 [Nowakowskiella sp. JEL0078]
MRYESPAYHNNLEQAENDVIRTLNNEHHHVIPLLSPLMDENDDEERTRCMLERYAKNGVNNSVTSVAKDPDHFFKEVVDSLPASPSPPQLNSSTPIPMTVNTNAEKVGGILKPNSESRSFYNALASVKIEVNSTSSSSNSSDVDNNSGNNLVQQTGVYKNQISRSAATSIISFGSEYSLNLQPSESKFEQSNLSKFVESSSLHRALNLASSTTVTSSATELPIVESISILDEFSAELKLDIDYPDKFKINEIKFEFTNPKKPLLAVEGSYAHILDEDLLAVSPTPTSRAMLLDPLIGDSDLQDRTSNSSYPTSLSSQPYNSHLYLTSPHPSLSRVSPQISASIITRTSTTNSNNSTTTVTKSKVQQLSSAVDLLPDALNIDNKMWVVDNMHDAIPGDDEVATVHSSSKWTFGSRSSFFKAYSDEMDAKSISMRSGNGDLGISLPSEGETLPLSSAGVDNNSGHELPKHLEYAVWGGDV